MAVAGMPSMYTVHDGTSYGGKSRRLHGESTCERKVDPTASPEII
ncbi:MAG: hypothetical protein ACYS4W_07280 [Planctomycetota bacterium]